MGSSSMILLLSGGIDSPVAGYLMGRQGVRIIALTGFVNPSGDERHIEKIGRQLDRICDAIKEPVRLFVFEQRKALSCFQRSRRPGLSCVMCKRAMLRTAEWLCGKTGSTAIIMGDSIGQVASQTLQNMVVIEEAISVPVIRPLIGFDKVEIVRMAEKIGTYEISNMPAPICAFVPDRPATKARLEDVKEEEKRLNIDSLIDQLIETVKEADISSQTGD